MRLKGDLGFSLKGGFGFRESFGLQGQGFRVWRAGGLGSRVQALGFGGVRVLGFGGRFWVVAA